MHGLIFWKRSSSKWRCSSMNNVERTVEGIGGETMMAMLMAQRVILDKMTFAEVPSSLQPQVKEILIDSGMGHLAE